VREDLRSIFDEVGSGPGGVGTGPMSVLKYSPEMSRRAIPLFNYVRNESTLSPKVRELAMLTTARAKDCPYIWHVYAPLGRRAGLPDALVDALRDRKPLPPMSVDEAVVINLGMEFFQTSQVSQETFAVALEQFGPQGLQAQTAAQFQGTSPRAPSSGAFEERCVTPDCYKQIIPHTSSSSWRWRQLPSV
jgi:4-carboxymuconolactone decarboxylase